MLNTTSPWTLALAVVWLAGCSAVTDFGRYHAAGDASIDADASAGDGGGDCGATAETCNGADDDCDGMVDEDFDLDTDPANCGRCENTCADPSHGTAACTSGACGVTCDADFGDCDGDASNGCEADLTRPESCGSCGNACDTGLLCDGGDCVSSCSAGLTECDGSCVDVSTSINHCGMCRNACPDPMGSTPSCSGGVCGSDCDMGRGDCDGDPSNGCEADLSSPASCGTCGNVCDFPNGIAVCDTGSCVLAACDMGYDDCDGDRSNGCEADSTSPATCGGCGAVCPMDAPVCSGGTCDTGCATSTDMLCSGACVDVNTHLDNCGSCGNVCPGGPMSSRTCSGGSCGIRCNAGFADCDGDPTTGCEVDITRPVSCGSCTRTCTVMNGMPGCTSGMCTIAGCNVGFDNCDGDLSNGCETPLMMSLLDCGSCGNTCNLECAMGTCNEATRVDAGGGSCAIQSNGNLVCWGANANGQIGDGTYTQRPRPTRVMIGMVTDVSSGRAHTCAVRGDNSAWCWGDGTDGKLGDGTASGMTNMPVHVMGTGPSGARMVQVGAGDNFSCGRTSAGLVQCWGNNGFGQLGNGTTASSNTPVNVSLGSLRAMDLSVGRQHACIVTTGGAVACWGHNAQGQLGLGNTTIYFTTPQTSMVTGAIGVSAGAFHTCAVRTAGDVRCFGDNMHGQLGNGSLVASSTPVVASVAGGITFDDVSAGYQHTCAHTTANTIHCWGDNSSRQVGNGMTTDMTVPYQIGYDYRMLDAGRFHSCALDLSNQLFCWGSGIGGTIGDGFTATRDMPTAVVNIPPPP